MAATAKKKRRSKRPKVEVNVEELDKIVDSAVEQPLTQGEAEKLRGAIHAMAEALLAKQRSTEKTEKIINEAAEKDEDGNPESQKLPAPGHGRMPVEAYTAAERVKVPHPELKSGQLCPECEKGKLSEKKPRTLVRITGAAPLRATVYELQRLRCSLCGHLFTAQTPEGVSSEKYGPSSRSILAVLKYGYGTPYDRLARMQKSLGIPMPNSTQYELLEDLAILLKPIFRELLMRVAQVGLIHIDDTKMRILKIERPPEDPRTGLFTTGVVGVEGDIKIAIFFTGTQHAGENLTDVLKNRAAELESPILMCDALSWNTSKLDAPDAVRLAHCLAHGRRKFVEIAHNFPESCLHVLGELAKIYGHDKTTKEEKMSPAERLKYHKTHSRPIMTALKAWIDEQFEQKKVEPNSPLGGALKYLKKHWSPLTLFLRDGRASLDNNICERAIKKAVLNRKNALFYRTLNGAQIGDLFMALIHTCELNGVNPFEYLNHLQSLPTEELQNNAGNLLPWNYQLQPAEPS